MVVYAVRDAKDNRQIFYSAKPALEIAVMRGYQETKCQSVFVYASYDDAVDQLGEPLRVMTIRVTETNWRDLR